MDIIKNNNSDSSEQKSRESVQSISDFTPVKNMIMTKNKEEEQTKLISKKDKKDDNIEKSKNRCNQCNKKSHLLFPCKCDMVFCNKHLQPEIHQCISMDKYREDARKCLEKRLKEEKVCPLKVDII